MLAGVARDGSRKDVQDIAVKNPPIIDDVTFEALMADPYPAFRRMQDTASVVFVPAAKLHLVTRTKDIQTVEANPAVFASSNPISLMNKVMGHSLMRKDFEDHARERKALGASFQQKVIKDHWGPRAEAIADDLVRGFEAKGRADLFGDFAAPFASRMLMEMLGFEGVDWRDLARWSQAMMDGIGNYAGDPEIDRRAREATDGTRTAIDRVMARHAAAENPSILSSIAHSGIPHSPEQVHANVNVIVGGGLNEPRDAVLTLTLGLLENPDQLAAVLADESLWPQAFEEAVRWISPIGMYPRMVQETTVLGDTEVAQGMQLGICVGAANRERGVFEDPDRFDIFRSRRAHLAFGAGPHYCAGTFVSRLAVGKVAVPMLFARLRHLRLDPDRTADIRGWVFRGPVNLPVVWDV